ncbi:MAG TPA: DNA polymerase Y family protein [Xanthobacteraceae bacterium]
MMSAPSSRRRYLSVWLRRLATDRIARAASAPPETAPLCIAQSVKSALRLAAVNDAAARLGLKAGMALADAKAMYPTLIVADADPDAEQRLLAAIADWCDRYTPLIGLDPPDGLTLDITGCAHLFGGEAAFCGNIVQQLARQGFAARAAIADTVGCAWAVARYFRHPPLQGEGRIAEGNPGRGPPAYAIAPMGGVRDALLPLRLAALRIAPDIEAGLAQAGLKCIADVIDRPRAPLAARFGEHFIRRIDQALGREDEPITPRLPIPLYVAERRFADPILLEADVLGTTEALAQELARMLERRGEGARRLEVALFRTDGKVYRTTVGTGAPLRDPARIRALFAERLTAIGDACDPGFGFDVVRLAALATERCDPLQTGLAAADHAAELTHLVDRLGARFGLRRVTRLVPQDTHIPEFAVAAVAAASFKTRSCGPLLRMRCILPHGEERGQSSDLILRSRAAPGVSKDGCAAQTRGHPSRRAQERAPQDEAATASAGIQADSLCPARPIRLFGWPEPIEAIAEVPDGPPVRFRWRRVLHQVASAEGPERIAMEWWRDRNGRALTRDYFRIESREGVRVWVYREGLYGHELAEPRWFLHGLFA